MDKIAPAGPSASDASQQNLTRGAEPTPASDGGIFDDFALLGALVLGIEDADPGCPAMTDE